MIRIIETQRKFRLDPRRTDLTFQEQVRLAASSPRRANKEVTLTKGKHVIPLFSLSGKLVVDVYSNTRGELREEPSEIALAQAAKAGFLIAPELTTPQRVVQLTPGSIEPLVIEGLIRRKIKTRKFLVVDDQE